MEELQKDLDEWMDTITMNELINVKSAMEEYHLKLYLMENRYG